MKVIGTIEIDNFKKKHPQSRGALDSWLAVAKQADWKSLNDVKQVLPKASQIGKSDIIIFDIKGNDFRLAVRARFQSGLLMVTGVYTHAEYDRQSFKGKGDGN